MLSRLIYRLRQFWNALPGAQELVPESALLAVLTPAQCILFRRLQASEQAHAYQLFKSLQAAGHTEPDLLAAALLHDVGKIQVPLSLFDRILVVIGKRFFRCAAQRWAAGPVGGMRTPFVVAAHHAAWGADLAARAGASGLIVELIRRHHDPALADSSTLFGRLLAALRAADEES